MFTLDPITILIRALVLVTAMPVHECAHGLVADKLGDHTARSAGRLTLNPFHHLDLTGSLLLLLAGFGWQSRCRSTPITSPKSATARRASR